MTFHYIDWFLGILTVFLILPDTIGQYNPQYKPTNQAFEHSSNVEKKSWFKNAVQSVHVFWVI